MVPKPASKEKVRDQKKGLEVYRMSKRELEKKVEDQHRQILHYEKKLKDVVRAYKSLEAEKVALESVVSSLEEKQDETEGESTQAKVSSPEDDLSTLNSLKAALATLTKEKNRREGAFQNDKKVLLTENEALKEKLKHAADEREAEADKMEKLVKDLSAKVRRIEGDREREIDDHGAVLSEMQQRYAKEKQSAETAHKQLVELYKKLQDKEDLPLKFKTREKELEIELDQWKNKAARTPTVQILQDQLTNLKLDHKRELEEAVRTTKSTIGEDKKTLLRLEELEAACQRLTVQVADADRERQLAEDLLAKAKEENMELKQLNIRLDNDKATAGSNGTGGADPVQAVKDAVAALQKARPGFVIHELFEADPRLRKMESAMESIQDQYEKYKLKAEAVLKSKQSSTTSTGASEDTDDGGLRVLVGRLHEKLRQLDVSHASDQAQYELTTRNLRERIDELERIELKCRSEMKLEMQTKISEMEAEMQKQRQRTLVVLAEKEQELEVTRSILVSLRSEQLGNAAPADPPHKVFVSKRKSSDMKKHVDRRISSGSRRSVDAVSVCSADAYHGSDGMNVSLPNSVETRNMFYEDEIAKKDRDALEMRNNVHHLDFRLRDLEQNSLVKDLKHHEVAEKLKEEIRILEGKLRLISNESSADMEYMRNIFVQFLNCGSQSGGKSILKAMGMVLKLSPNELKALDKK